MANNLSEQDVLDKAGTLSFPRSVVEYFQGYLGQPPYGFPEPLRTKIIRDLPRIDERPGATMKPIDFTLLQQQLTEQFGPVRDVDVISSSLYPAVCSYSN